MLSERLRDLEAAGLIERTVIPSSPPTVEYRLTARGRRLGPVIEAMRAYAAEPATDEPPTEGPVEEEPVRS